LVRLRVGLRLRALLAPLGGALLFELVILPDQFAVCDAAEPFDGGPELLGHGVGPRVVAIHSLTERPDASAQLTKKLRCGLRRFGHRRAPVFLREAYHWNATRSIIASSVDLRNSLCYLAHFASRSECRHAGERPNLMPEGHFPWRGGGLGRPSRACR
jgi:hypothetical protein